MSLKSYIHIDAARAFVVCNVDKVYLFKSLWRFLHLPGRCLLAKSALLPHFPHTFYEFKTRPKNHVFGDAKRVCKPAWRQVQRFWARHRRIYLLDRLANFSSRFLDNVHIVLNVPSSVHLEYREKVPNLY
jgi:hypothetical protein